MKNKIIYLFRKQFTKGSKRLYLWLSFFSILPIVLLSLIIFIAAFFDPSINPIGDQENNFWHVFFSQLLAALDPGNFLVYDVIDGTTPPPGESTSWGGGVLFVVCSLRVIKKT